MHTASYEFLMKPKESAGCHQTLSAWVGSGDETRASPTYTGDYKTLDPGPEDRGPKDPRHSANPRIVSFIAYKTTSVTRLVHGSYSHCDPRVKGQMRIISRLSRSVCRDGVQAWLCKTDSRLLWDQRSQRIALSAINNAFGVHSDHVQDIVAS